MLYENGFSAYIIRAYYRAENGDNTFAVVDYSKAIKINPKEGGYYYNRGISHLYTGRTMFPDRNITKWARWIFGENKITRITC